MGNRCRVVRVDLMTQVTSRKLKRLSHWIPTVNGALAVWLALTVVVLFILVGIVHRWHQGGGANSVEAAVIWRVVWITYQIVKVWLVVVLVMMAYRWTQRTV